MQKLAVLELNELNFEILEAYMAHGDLPNFRRFFDRHGYCETTSEIRYSELEPWIQWVTAHTGKGFADHGIFRLGDIIHSEIPQIWETLERNGLKVGAVSPMNAENRLRSAAFFVPDPWTATRTSGGWFLQGLARAVCQAVNDNAAGGLTLESAFFLAAGMLRFARPWNYLTYLFYLGDMKKRPWNKARLFDLFLGDLFIGLTRKRNPAFCTLFVNGAAHLQHHYLLNSPAVLKSKGNPEWYIDNSEDPVGDIYRTYDRLLGSVVRMLPDYRLFLVTALHQDPCPSPYFYWRLRDHADFLHRLGCRFAKVQPRMSRDFEVEFSSRADLERCLATLKVSTIDDQQAFNADDRGTRIFVEFIFAREIHYDSKLIAGEIQVDSLHKHVAFVALKNGVHNGVGYFSDSGTRRGALPKEMALPHVHDEILRAFGLAPVLRLDPWATATPASASN